MFTGIIDHSGSIIRIEAEQLWIRHSFAHLELGESISVDGICLTVTQFHDDVFGCDVSPETFKLTTAKYYKPGQAVNLERALQLSSRLGGHFVTGHVDQMIRLKSIKSVEPFIEMQFTGLDKETQQFVTKKGSIAINGVSLTINETTPDGFSVMLVPHTLERTNLHQLQENEAVNVEFDILARMVARQLESFKR